MRIALFSLLLSFAACDPNVDMENIPAEKLLSVTCFLSPQDTLFKVYVFRGSEIGSTVWYDSAAVKDAEVTISDGQSYDTLQLAFDIDLISGRKIYKYEGRKKNVTVSTNATYFLSVQTPLGEKADATCTIPPAPGAPEISGIQENNDYKFRINWNNASLYKYFILILDAEGSYNNPYPGGNGTIDLQPSLLESIEFPSDKQVADNYYDAVLAYAYVSDNAELMVSVRNIDEGLFQYYKSYQKYQDWDANNSGNLFPNFQEMPLIYSNIHGGVGIFGGYNDSKTKIPL